MQCYSSSWIKVMWGHDIHEWLSYFVLHTWLDNNCISSVMVSMLSWCVVDLGFQLVGSVQRQWKFVLAASPLRNRSKDFLAHNQNNMVKWGFKQICFSEFEHYKDPTKHVGLVQRRLNYHLNEGNLFWS